MKTKLFLYTICLFLFIIDKTPAVVAQNFTDSNLPIVIIQTDIDPNTGQPIAIPDEPKVPASMKIIFRPDSSRNYVSDQNNPEYLNYNGRIGIETRGSTSQSLPKKPYGLTTRKDDNVSNNNVSLLGMPKENDWILNSFAFDPSMMRDFISYELARRVSDYAVRTVYCELIVNNDYKGLYILSEKIKIDSDRLNLIKLAANDNSFPEISGGYITKADKTTGGDPIAWEMPSYAGENGWVRYIHHQPKPGAITTQQHNYIKDQFFNLQNLVTNQNISSANGFPSIIDIPSFIDFILLNELASNVDAYQYSTFFHKDRNGKLRAGPLWDLNLTYGNDLFLYGYNRSKTNVWQFNYHSNRGSKFWKDLFDENTFKCYLTKRWRELNAPGQYLHYNEIIKLIDETVVWISEAVEREDQRWGTIGNYPYHITNLKNWLNERINWLNNQLINYQACANPNLPPLVISKIHYHPKAEAGFDKDDLEFIEITNNGDKTVDLTGIYLRELGISFQFIPYTEAAPHQKLFIASNAAVFEQFYGFPPFAQYTRTLSNKSFRLLLCDAWGNIINEVHYYDSDPWPKQADGKGPYLKLIDINLDNSLPENWIASDEQLVGINDPVKKDPEFIIMPHPVNNGSTQLQSTRVFDSVRIHSLQGQLIFQKKINPTETYSLNLQELTQGMYRIFVSSEKQIVFSGPLIIL